MATLTTSQLMLIKDATKGDKTQAMSLQMSCESAIKDVTIAYIIGALFGCFGAHRIYAGQLALGILQFVSVMCIIGVLWVLADVFLTKGLIEKVNDDIVREKVQQYIIMNPSEEK